MNFRGLVVSPPIEISVNRNSIHLVSTSLDPQEVRSNLLFWDKLNFPDNNLLSIGLGPDEEFLRQCGILERTMIRVMGSGDMASGFRAAHVRAFQELDNAAPGAWSLATGEHSVSFLDEELEPGRGALVRLYKAIPVPDRAAPLNDILNFKQRRKDELLALRFHLEDIYQKVVKAGDGPLSLATETGRLEKALSDHLKASKESRLGFRLCDLSASLNVPGALAGTLLFESFPENLIAGAALSISVGVALKRKKPSATPFRYVSRYHDELF